MNRLALCAAFETGAEGILLLSVIIASGKRGPADSVRRHSGISLPISSPRSLTQNL
jgi:hypothetical protein